MRPATWLVILALAMSSTIGGGAMIAVKFAYGSFEFGQIIFLRVLIASIFFIIMLPRWRHLPYRKGDWKYLLAVVGCEPVLTFMFTVLGMQFTSASEGGVVDACYPICAAVMAWFVLHEKLSRRTIIGLILAVTGVAGMSLLSTEGSSDASNPLLGNLLVFASTISGGGYVVATRYVARRYSPMSIAAIQSFGGTIAFFPFFMAYSWPADIAWSAIAGILYLGLGVGVTAYVLFNFAIHYVEAAFAALFGNLIPVFTLIFAYIFLGERMTPSQIFFSCIIMTGVLIATTQKRVEQPT